MTTFKLGQWVYYSGPHLAHGLYRFTALCSPLGRRGRVRTARPIDHNFYGIYEVDMVDIRPATEQEVLFFAVEDQSSELP